MHPVQRALHIGQASAAECADQSGIRLHAEADAIDHAVIAHIGAREHVDIGMHSRLDVPELGLAEVGDGPPDARVDQREHLLAGVGVSALRDGEIGDARVKRRIDAAVVQVIFGSADVGGLAFALRGQRLQRQHAVLRLGQLRMALRSSPL